MNPRDSHIYSLLCIIKSGNIGLAKYSIFLLAEFGGVQDECSSTYLRSLQSQYTLEYLDLYDQVARLKQLIPIEFPKSNETFS